MKKVGGLYFWSIGRVGGSIYIRKDAVGFHPLAIASLCLNVAAICFLLAAGGVG